MDDEAIRRLEELSALRLPAADRPALAADVQAILVFVDRLAPLPPNDAAAAESPKPDSPLSPPADPVPLDRDTLIEAAPCLRDGFFVVPEDRAGQDEP